MIGFIIGAIRMILDFTYQPPLCGQPDTRPAITKGLHYHYMYFALVLFWITAIAIVVISLFTKPHEGANVSTEIDGYIDIESVYKAA